MNNNSALPGRLNGLDSARFWITTIGSAIGIVAAVGGVTLWVTGGLGPGEHKAALLSERLKSVEEKLGRVERIVDEKVVGLSSDISWIKARIEELSRSVDRMMKQDSRQ